MSGRYALSEGGVSDNDRGTPALAKTGLGRGTRGIVTARSSDHNSCRTPALANSGLGRGTRGIVTPQNDRTEARSVD